MYTGYDSIARTSSGCGAVFLGREILMYTYGGRNIQFYYKYIMCSFVLFAPGT